MSSKDVQQHLSEGISHLREATNELNAILGTDRAEATTGLSTLPIQEHYKIFRDYVEHEDNLINNRLMWNITIQGFLFATYGFAVEKLVESPINENRLFALRGLIVVLPLFGIGISLVSFMGVVAAQSAIKNLVTQWNEIHQTNGQQLPYLIGGGVPDGDKSGKEATQAHRRGFWAPLCFPWIFVAAWAALLFHCLSHRGW